MVLQQGRWRQRSRSRYGSTPRHLTDGTIEEGPPDDQPWDKRKLEHGRFPTARCHDCPVPTGTDRCDREPPAAATRHPKTLNVVTRVRPIHAGPKPTRVTSTGLRQRRPQPDGCGTRPKNSPNNQPTNRPPRTRPHLDQARNKPAGQACRRHRVDRPPNHARPPPHATTASIATASGGPHARPRAATRTLDDAAPERRGKKKGRAATTFTRRQWTGADREPTHRATPRRGGCSAAPRPRAPPTPCSLRAARHEVASCKPDAGLCALKATALSGC